jgi:hypothetical protein
MNKGTHNVLTTLGTNNGSTADRQKDDFYATDPKATKMALAELGKYYDTSLWEVWEPAAGMGHISNTLKSEGINVVKESDLIDRGIGATIENFLETDSIGNANVIFTNPPYKIAEDFLKHFLEISDDNDLYVFLGRIQFLEGSKRRKIFDENPPKYVLVHSKRINCWKDGKEVKESSAMCYAWFVFEKGYKGDTIVKWL